MSAQLASKINKLCQQIKNINKRVIINEIVHSKFPLDSGTAILTASNPLNMANISINQALFTKIGQIVNFSFGFSADITGGSGGEFDLTLPISSDFTSFNDAYGVVTDFDENNIGVIRSQAGTNLLRVFVDTDLAIVTLNIPVGMVQYIII